MHFLHFKYPSATPQNYLQAVRSRFQRTNSKCAFLLAKIALLYSFYDSEWLFLLICFFCSEQCFFFLTIALIWQHLHTQSWMTVLMFISDPFRTMNHLLFWPYSDIWWVYFTANGMFFLYTIGSTDGGGSGRCPQWQPTATVVNWSSFKLDKGKSVCILTL